MYGKTADFYDLMMKDVDYEAYARYFTEIFRKFSDRDIHTVLEAGCGTGNLTLELAGKGLDMTGVDSSSEMLSAAYTKKGPGILWINQDVAGLDLFGTYDAAISLLDFPNHITDPDDLDVYFRKVHMFLEPGGLFVFDINSEYRFREILSNNVFYYDDEDYSCIWQNHYDKGSGLCRMDITLFVRVGGFFRREDAVNIERNYPKDAVSEKLGKAGFEIIDICGDMKFGPPAEKDERIFFITRKASNV